MCPEMSYKRICSQHLRNQSAVDQLVSPQIIISTFLKDRWIICLSSVLEDALISMTFQKWWSVARMWQRYYLISARYMEWIISICGKGNWFVESQIWSLISCLGLVNWLHWTAFNLIHLVKNWLILKNLSISMSPVTLHGLTGADSWGTGWRGHAWRILCIISWSLAGRICTCGWKRLA